MEPIRELRIQPPPPVDEQRKLADLLWAAEETKNACKELLAITDELVKAQFIELFGDPVMNPLGWNITTMRKTSERLSDGPFGSNLKSEHYSDSGIRVIRLQNIGVGEYIDKDKAFIPEEHYQTIKKYTCKSGDIVIGTLGEPNLRACIIPDSIEIAINKADCVHYIPRKEILNKIFVCQYINYLSTLTLAMPRVYLATLREIAEVLNTSAGGRGETILYERQVWSDRAVGRGTIDAIPDVWEFSSDRSAYLFGQN